MRLRDRIGKYDGTLTVRKRLAVSNVIMFAVPVAVTAAVAFAALGAAYLVFVRFYLPRLGLDLKSIHDMGERYEDDLRSFVLFAALLVAVMLALLVAAIAVTNRFLTRFLIRVIGEPLDGIAASVERISSGDLETPVVYERHDEFRPAFDAVELMRTRLRESAERTEAEEQSRRELFAGISHDLRSPLTSVRAYTEALIDGVAATPEDERRYLEKIRTHELEIERLTGSLFLYSKLGLKEYPVHLQTLDLRAELMRTVGDNPMEHLEADLTAVPPLYVTADRMLLERIAVNLLGNSCKYRSGGTAHVTVSAEKCGAGVRVCFADDGPGVPDAVLGRLFDAFYRADPARGDHADGSGLGLAVVRRAVERMGGKVSAENSASGGLCVYIVLPEGDAEKQ